jgi:hypothetical protein
MIRWQVLAVGSLIFGLSGIAWGYAQQTKPVGFFELRIYMAKPGERSELAARFQKSTAKVYARHGITNVGYWFAASDEKALGVTQERTFVYMRGYPSAAERDRRLKAAHDDPEFIRVVLGQENNPSAALIEKMQQIDLVPATTDSSITISK